MQRFSQKDPKWANVKLGTSNTTIGQNGCFLVSLSMLANMLPPDANKLLTDGGGYANGNMMISQKASEILGLNFHGRVNAALPYPTTPCIMETNKFAPYYPQHFTVYLGHDDLILDPLDGREKVNPYPIVSFRLFDPKPTPPSEADISFQWMKDEQVYSEFTQRNTPLTTDTYAIFEYRKFHHL